MPVYVDEIQRWPTKIRCFQEGSCHLTADTTAELHAFARRLGLRPEWFQNRSTAPHYDLTPGKRDKALKLGAVFVSGKEQARARIEARRATLASGIHDEANSIYPIVETEPPKPIAPKCKHGKHDCERCGQRFDDQPHTTVDGRGPVGALRKA